MPESDWTLLMAGRLDEAVAAASEEIARRPRSSIGYTNRGIIYLVQRRLVEASADFQHVIAISPGSQYSYILYGACQWLLDESTAAVSTWKSGIGAVYTDAAGGAELPLLLSYASARLGDDALRREARDLLRRAARRKAIFYGWPGPCALYLLDKLSADEMLHRAQTRAPRLTERHLVQVVFYEGARALMAGDQAAFQAKMRECASNPAVYLEIEYFLARWEGEQCERAESH